MDSWMENFIALRRLKELQNEFIENKYKRKKDK